MNEIRNNMSLGRRRRPRPLMRRLSRNSRDRIAIFTGFLFIAICIALVPLSLWLHFAAPCDAVDWMPTKDVPARCLPTGGDR